MARRLDPLQAKAAIVNDDKSPSPYFQRQWQELLQAVVNATTAQAGNAALLARNLIAGVGLTGGGNLTADRTFNLANTAVTPGTYGSSTQSAVITVDQQGRLTAASQAAISGGGGASGVFSGATGNTASPSTSAFATKGEFFTPDVNMTITSITGFFVVTAASQNHNAQIVSMTGSTSADTVVAVLGTSATVASGTGTASIRPFKFVFSPGVSLVAGTTYALLVVNASGAGTVICRVASQSGSGTETWVLNAPGTHPLSNAIAFNTVNVTAAQAISAGPTANAHFCLFPTGTVP